MVDNGKSILIVEDDENDLLFLRMAFEKVGIDNAVHTVNDGSQAIDYLSGTGIYGDRDKFPFPSLMMLDLKMPIVNGFEVLDWWHESGQRSDLPIIVLSGSPLSQDIEKARSLGATAYRVKRAGDPTLLNLACEIRDHWLLAPSQASQSAPTQVEFFNSFL